MISFNFFIRKSDNDIARAIHHIIMWRPSRVTPIESSASIGSFRIDNDIFDIDSGKIFLNEEELIVSSKLVNLLSDDFKKIHTLKVRFDDDFIEPQERHTKEYWKKISKNLLK